MAAAAGSAAGRLESRMHEMAAATVKRTARSPIIVGHTRPIADTHGRVMYEKSVGNRERLLAGKEIFMTPPDSVSGQGFAEITISSPDSLTAMSDRALRNRIRDDGSVDEKIPVTFNSAIAASRMVSWRLL